MNLVVFDPYTIAEGSIMENVISLQGHKAEERLAWLHRAKNAGVESAKMLSDAIESNDEHHMMVFPGVELIPMSFSDIGMNSIEELVQAFADLDDALARRDNKAIEVHLAKLLGKKQLNLKLV